MKELKTYSPELALIEYRKCNSVELCVQSNSPQLSVLRKESSEDKVLALIEMWILDINEYFNVQRKMNPRQIKETALFILEDYYYFKIADINYIFSQAKKGKYGNLYGMLDGSVIYKWFEEHDISRSNLYYQNALKDHDIEKSKESRRK